MWEKELQKNSKDYNKNKKQLNIYVELMKVTNSWNIVYKIKKGSLGCSICKIDLKGLRLGGGGGGETFLIN